MNIEHNLSTFAFHIYTLATAKPGDKFGLSFQGILKLDIEAMPGRFETTFRLDGVLVGNVDAAIERYVKLCAPAFESSLPAQVAGSIARFENRLGGEGRNASGQDYNDLVCRLLELMEQEKKE